MSCTTNRWEAHSEGKLTCVHGLHGADQFAGESSGPSTLSLEQQALRIIGQAHLLSDTAMPRCSSSAECLLPRQEQLDLCSGGEESISEIATSPFPKALSLGQLIVSD